MKSSNINFLYYANTKLVSTYKNLRDQITNLYNKYVYDRCTSDRHTIQNSLTLAKIAPNEFSYNYFNGPGYTGVVRGEVLHIIKY